ncbi:hypothetical protein AKJ09_11068 [Labilithrix luteola]|uniref:Uncharacterized protein n=1 Tax=Labilithrix luteola TaxID=1391654 RepID=A0A0K1QG44_9BACT|nr:hypothetical protein [Labilithrix luteola]AKV04405.1 hypothetical protein AKJ09_11068 [Labilithrix luteola]
MNADFSIERCFRGALAVASFSVVAAVVACAASDATGETMGDGGTILDPPDSAKDGALSDGGDAGAEDLGPCATDKACRVGTPLAVGAVTAMGGRSPNDVWATCARGLLMHWNGKQWAALESGVTETISSVFMTDDEMWGVSGTLVLRRGLDANSVRRFRSPVDVGALSGIAVLPSGDAYVSRPAMTTSVLGRISDFDAGAIEFVPAPIFPATGEVQAVNARATFLVPDKAFWLVGDHGLVTRYPVSPLGQGVVLTVPLQPDLFAAWGIGEELWAAGSGGAILHFDGSEWHVEETGTTETLNAIFGFAPDDIWSAGSAGMVLHFDGKKWSRVSLGQYDGDLRSIWGAASDDMWIGGERAMFHWGALP